MFSHLFMQSIQIIQRSFNMRGQDCYTLCVLWQRFPWPHVRCSFMLQCSNHLHNGVQQTAWLYVLTLSSQRMLMLLAAYADGTVRAVFSTRCMLGLLAACGNMQCMPSACLFHPSLHSQHTHSAQHQKELSAVKSHSIAQLCHSAIATQQ